jgi:hypothetical protein
VSKTGSEINFINKNKMKNREPVLRKLDTIESKMSKLWLALNQGNRDGCYQILEEMKETVEQTKGYIASEPMSGNELNRI